MEAPVKSKVISKEEIEDTHRKIQRFVHRTPILHSSTFNTLTGADLYFKCENFQRIGAFKYRGATNALLRLSKDEIDAGVTTHSSGNHAQAIAMSAKIQNTRAYIVMPENAPKVKINAVKGYDAKVIFCEPTLQARESTVEQVIKETGATFIHPFNDLRVIAGQATASKELIEDVHGLDIIIAPVGGGGLLSGTVLSARYFGNNIHVFGAEPEGADDAKKSFDAGSIIPSKNPNTIADGLLTSLGNHTFEIIKDGVKDILVVNDEEIVKAMKLMWERMKIIVEPSGAVPFACVLKYPDLFKNKRVGIVISGGNVDLASMSKLF